LFQTIRTYHIKLILFFYIFSAYVGATHIHHDAFVPHDDCKVCVVANNLHSSDITTTSSILTQIDTLYEEPSIFQRLCSITINKGFDSNAPPA